MMISRATCFQSQNLAMANFKFEKLKLSRVCISSLPIKFISQQLNGLSSLSKPYTDKSNPDSFAAKYLQRTHGFLPEKALLYSKYLRFDSPERPDSVSAFFKNHQFTDSQISNMVRKWPLIFLQVPESNFSPKIQYLSSLGFSSSEIVKILTTEPSMLGRGLESQLIPCVKFLRSFLKSDKDVAFSIMRYPRIFREKLQEHLLPNVEILREAGVPDIHIASLLKISPRRLAMDPEIFRLTVDKAKRLGLRPCKKIFIIGVTVMGEISNASWREKVDHYKHWGLSEDQILDAFRRYPRFMAVSKDKISRVMMFFLNEMGGDFSALIIRPGIVSLSFEGTIKPRFAVYQFLVTNGLVKKDISFSGMFSCSKELFVERYVDRYVKEAPQLLKVYQESLKD